MTVVSRKSIQNEKKEMKTFEFHCVAEKGGRRKIEISDINRESAIASFEAKHGDLKWYMTTEK